MIRVNYPALEAASGGIATCQTVMADQVDTLRVKLVALRDVWEGEARQAYDDCMTQWDGAALAIKDLLGQTSAKVTECMGLMAETDGRVAGTFLRR